MLIELNILFGLCGLSVLMLVVASIEMFILWRHGSHACAASIPDARKALSARYNCRAIQKCLSRLPEVPRCSAAEILHIMHLIQRPINCAIQSAFQRTFSSSW